VTIVDTIPQTGPAPAAPTVAPTPSTTPTAQPGTLAPTSNYCQLFALPSTFDLQACLGYLVVPQIDLGTRLTTITDQLTSRHPISDITAVASSMAYMGQWEGDDCLVYRVVWTAPWDFTAQLCPDSPFIPFIHTMTSMSLFAASVWALLRLRDKIAES